MVETVSWVAYPPMTDGQRVAAAQAFHAAIASRRTCREIGDAPVPRAVLEAAILAAGTAPSGANHQPWHFAVITDPARKSAIRVAAEAEERAFYAGKAGQEWLDALHRSAPMPTRPSWSRRRR